MQRRILAAVAASVLALVGAVLLLSYVGGADDRARADEETVQVLVADADIPIGTPANQLTAKVSTADVPARLVAADAVTDLAELADGKTTAALLAGEQLRVARFDENAKTVRSDGLEEISLTLEPQRAVGGNLSAGDRVAVFLTRTADGVTTSERTFDAVEVTRVTGADGSAVSGGGVTVTLALTTDQARTVVAGMYDNAVWLSLVEAITTSGDSK